MADRPTLGRRSLVFNPRQYSLQLVCLALIVGLSIYALCPLPEWFCKFTLLSYCTEVRALLTIGVANILFVVTILPMIGEQRLSKWVVAVATGLSAGFVILYLALATRDNPAFCTPARVVMYLTLDSAILLLVSLQYLRLFGITLISLLAASNALVNPVMCGVGPLVNSAPSAAIRELRQIDPDAGWAAYDVTAYSEFLMSQGVNVVSGLKIVPDLSFYALADPAGVHRNIYNRYSVAAFEYNRDPNVVRLEPLHFPTHIVYIHPLNRALQIANVRYFLFPGELNSPEEAGLELARALPENKMCIYRLKSKL